MLAVFALLLAACGDDDDEGADGGGGGEAPAELAAPLVIQADTVVGGANQPEGASVCVLQSRYPRNSEIVWRASIVDPVTGDELDDSQLSSVTVELPDGETVEMEYGDHPRQNPTDSFWAAGWDVPADYPTGALSYTITAEATDGRTATFEPFQVSASELTITDEVLTPVEEEEG